MHTYTLFRQYGFILFTITFCVFSFSAGASERDSLFTVLSTHPQNDTVKVEILTGIGGPYAQSNIDSMEFYAVEGLAISEKLHYEKGISTCSQQLSLVFLHKHESDKALKYFGVTLGFLQKKGNKPKQAEILIYMGDIEYRDTRYAEAIGYYSKAIKVSEESGAFKQEGLALIDIGGIYTEQGSYAEALNYYLKGLAVFEKEHENSGVSMTLVNIANVYSAMGNYKLALEYINRSIPITKGVTDKEVIFSNMVNIATAYSQMKDYQNALAAFNNGLRMADTLGDRTWRNICLADIADIYFQTGDFDSAYLKYTRLVNSGLEDTSVLVTAKCAIGEILLKKGKYNEAITELLPILSLSTKKHIKQSIFDAAKSLTGAYEALHDYKNALLYEKVIYDYRDSLNNDKIYKRIQQLQFDYELVKKEQEIALLKKDTLIAASDSAKEKVIVLSLLAGLVLLGAIIIILNKSRSHEKRRTEEIEKQKEDIQLQATQLKELSRFKDKTFSVLSHDLRSPLGLLTSTLMLLDNNVLTPDEFNMVMEELNNQLNSVNILLDNLLNWSKSYFQGKMSAKPELVAINNIVAQNIHLLHYIAASKNIMLVNNIGDSITAFCDPGQIDIVTRNLISNALKFTKENGTITISANHNGNEVQLTVADNGVGMAQEQLARIFTNTSVDSTYGTAGEKGIGLGLALCREFIKANNGNISAKSQLNKGTVITVTLPLNR